MASSSAAESGDATNNSHAHTAGAAITNGGHSVTSLVLCAMGRLTVKTTVLLRHGNLDRSALGKNIKADINGCGSESCLAVAEIIVPEPPKTFREAHLRDAGP